MTEYLDKKTFGRNPGVRKACTSSRLGAVRSIDYGCTFYGEALYA